MKEHLMAASSEGAAISTAGRARMIRRAKERRWCYEVLLFLKPFHDCQTMKLSEGGNFMWKIVVLRQLSMPEMMEETPFQAIDTMSGCKICLLLSVGTSWEHLFVLINESAHLNAHFFDLSCRNQANILWNEWPLTYWHYLRLHFLFKGVHMLNVPLKLIQIPFDIRSAALRTLQHKCYIQIPN